MIARKLSSNAIFASALSNGEENHQCAGSNGRRELIGLERSGTRLSRATLLFECESGKVEQENRALERADGNGL
jgi:hypothetical protein